MTPRSTPLASAPLLLAAFAPLALPACAATPYVDPRVAAAVEIKPVDPPSGCRYLGAVRGSAAIGDLDDANGEAARTAVLAGGNYVAVDFVEHPVADFIVGYAVRGRLFACPATALPPAAAPPAAAPAAGFAPPVGPCPAAAAPPATPAPCGAVLTAR